MKKNSKMLALKKQSKELHTGESCEKIAWNLIETCEQIGIDTTELRSVLARHSVIKGSNNK